VATNLIKQVLLIEVKKMAQVQQLLQMVMTLVLMTFILLQQAKKGGKNFDVKVISSLKSIPVVTKDIC
jgi:hypothetical protein